MSELTAPAETYKLNTLASVLSRYAVPDLSASTRLQVGEMLDATIDDIIAYNVPVVPHTRTELLEEATAFDRKLLDQLRSGPAEQYVTDAQRRVVEGILSKHANHCVDARQKDAPWEMLVSPYAIAAAYGLNNLWEDPSGVIREEVDKWGKYTAHPDVPTMLRQRVGLDETRRLMSLMWRRVIGVTNEPDVHVYLTDDAQNYHVYWSPVAERLDYATPRDYDRATQLSFDLPHNATHLAHLDAMQSGAGAARYDDSMPLRAYFEAVTVFSEQQTIGVAEEDPEFGEELSDILSIPPAEAGQMGVAEWVSHDRRYEFKLRAARYAADVMMTSGVTFDDTVSEISATFGIPVTDAANETRKYLAWTGLGAVYTFGYRQLEAAGVSTVMDAIRPTQGDAITSWATFPGKR